MLAEDNFGELRLRAEYIYQAARPIHLSLVVVLVLARYTNNWNLYPVQVQPHHLHTGLTGCVKHRVVECSQGLYCSTKQSETRGGDCD